MTDSDIEIDDAPKDPKAKSAVPVWMAVLVVVSFLCLVATVALQFMEYQYLRGASSSETDTYASRVLIPKS